MADEDTIQLGDLNVRRLGFGTMQLTGAGVWGRPRITTAHSRSCGAVSNSAST